MATATALVDSARSLDLELRRCEEQLSEVRTSILARREPEDIRRTFRRARDAMMSVGRLLLSHGQLRDGRFAPRLPAHVRNEALDMLREGAAPIAVQKKLGLTGVTVQNLRHRELRDHRNLLHARKLTEAQVAEIRKAGNGTLRRGFAAKIVVAIDVASKARCSRGSYREAVPVLSPVQTRKRPGPSTTNKMTLRFNAQLMESLTEMAELTSPKRPGIPEIQSYVIALAASWSGLGTAP